MLNRRLIIAVVDDDIAERTQVKRAIKRSQLPSICMEAGSTQDVLAGRGVRIEFDCAIVKYQIPGEDCLACISALRQKFPYMSIIVATGPGHELISTEAMKRGANDYIRRADITPHFLRQRIEGSIEKVTRMRRRRQVWEEQFAQLVSQRCEIAATLHRQSYRQLTQNGVIVNCEIEKPGYKGVEPPRHG